MGRCSMLFWGGQRSQNRKAIRQSVQAKAAQGLAAAMSGQWRTVLEWHDGSNGNRADIRHCHSTTCRWSSCQIQVCGSQLRSNDDIFAESAFLFVGKDSKCTAAGASSTQQLPVMSPTRTHNWYRHATHQHIPVLTHWHVSRTYVKSYTSSTPVLSWHVLNCMQIDSSSSWSSSRQVLALRRSCSSSCCPDSLWHRS